MNGSVDIVTFCKHLQILMRVTWHQLLSKLVHSNPVCYETLVHNKTMETYTYEVHNIDIGSLIFFI